jgi:hypothetical protein
LAEKNEESMSVVKPEDSVDTADECENIGEQEIIDTKFHNMSVIVGLNGSHSIPPA